MKEEIEKLKITDKNFLDREQYRKKSRFLWKIKKNGRILRGRRNRRNAEMIRKYWDKRKAKMRKEK